MEDNRTYTKDEKYMKMALALAEKGRGHVDPNPMVGAVIVKDDKVMGRGYHEKYGEAHAEPNAIRSCSESPEGATIYVTLEPCCHHGKTPPCTEAIMKSGIKRVVVGAVDPNKKVAGRGIGILRDAGINVECGILEKESRKLNCVFFHFITTGLPYVTMKYAMTMDGKIAASTGDSKWITGPEAREHVHMERSYNKGIMAGLGTVIQDDPMLTSRTDKGSGATPVRIICDTNLKTPVDAKVVESASETPTIIATSSTDESAHKPYLEKGCRIITVTKNDRHIDLNELMKKLGEEGMSSIYLEGGSTLNWEMVKAGLVNRVNTYIAPKLFGGEKSKTPIGGEGIHLLKDCVMLEQQRITKIGNDIMIESEVKRCLQE